MPALTIPKLFKNALFYTAIFFSCLIVSWQASAKIIAKAPLIDISTCADLQNIRNDLTSQYVLTGDIDCSGVNFSPIGTTTSNPFTGSLDGAGYKIKNLSIQSANDYVGLFGIVNGAYISRITLENVQVSGKNYVGALIGSVLGTKATNVSVVQAQGNVTAIQGGSSVGGLVGSLNASGSIVQDSSASVVVEALASPSQYIGGLVGFMAVGNINRSYATGTVKGGGADIGGLVGNVSVSAGGSVTDSYATGEVIGSINSVGGLIGGGTVNITRSHATGSVTGGGVEFGGVGGLIGYHTGGDIVDSYATGTVKGLTTSTGGLIGRHNSGTNISRDYATGKVTGNQNTGGLIGYDNSSSSKISNCYATGSVNGSDNTGGLIGYAAYGNISNSYATGPVSGLNGTGGLVGNKISGVGVTNSYSVGSVSGSATNIGGLIGIGSSANVTSSYWDTQTSGQATSIGGTGKTTAQMQQQSTYVNWDFVSTWNIHEGKSYPWLRSTGQEIKNCADLQAIKDDLSGVHRLVADVDCSGVALSPLGTTQKPFTGILDGDGFTISNAEIKQDGQSFVGLFSATQGAQIVDLALKNIYVSGQRVTGSLVGYAFGDTQISGISAAGTVEAKGSSDLNNIGGLVGVLAEGSVNQSSAAITVNAAGANVVGGLIGQNSGLVWNSYSLGAINGAGNVGGLVGDNTGTLNNTYSIGKVTGTSNTGGLVGSGNGLAASSYWDTQTSGQSTSASGVGKTTNEMYQQSTYVGWDFKNIWNIFNGYTYPWLRDQVGQALVTKLK